MFDFQYIQNRFQEGWKHLTLINLIQIFLMIIFTVLSFIFPTYFEGFSSIKASENFIKTIPWMFLHYFIHGNILHLFFNASTMLFFNSNIERRIGSTQYLLFFLLHSICEPLLLISMYKLGIYYGESIIGMSGFIFAIFVISMYQPGSYFDILYSSILNIISYLFVFMLGGRVSLFGHFTGIFTGFLFTREFFSFIFKSSLIQFLEEKIMVKLFGKYQSFVKLTPESYLNDQSHLQIMKTIKTDVQETIQKLMNTCKKSNNTNDETILPI